MNAPSAKTLNLMKILIVEDSSTIRKIAARELTDGGYEIVEAANGEEALHHLSQNSFDLMTLDIELGELNGFDVLEKIKSPEFARSLVIQFTPPPVVFLTGMDSLEVRRRGFDKGAMDFITKPFLSGELLRTVDNILKPQDRYRGMDVLIVDDSPAVRNIVGDILKKEGMNTHLAEDGQQAFEYAREHLKDLDLIITDIHMPHMTGIELCDKVRKDLNHKGMPIIVLSAASDQKDILEVFKAGASDYLNKPFAKEELLARMRVHMDLRYTNRELSRKVSQLKRLGKMKDDFLAVCSHDLVGPLGAIRGFADLIDLTQPGPEQTSQYTLQIRKSVDYLVTLVRELLDIGRIQASSEEMEMVLLDIANVLEESKPSLEQLASMKDVKLTAHLAASGRGLMNGNKSALIRIINNLTINAIKFTPQKGAVDILLNEDPETKEICLSVNDTGIGIPETMIPQLFDPKANTSRPGTDGEVSTGLGLSIVQKLVEQHGGRINVNSQEGTGTSFHICFPKAN